MKAERPYATGNRPPRPTTERIKRERRPRPPRRQRSLGRSLLITLLLVPVIVGALAAAGGLFYIQTRIVPRLPAIDNLYVIQRKPAITVLAADGTEIGHVGDYQADLLSLDEMSPHLVHAVLAIEDRRFYQHWGVDPIGIARAAYTNWRAGHTVQGGSTITQQLAKILFLSPEQTLERKLEEAVLALKIEGRYSKDQILEAYLNQVYLGGGAWGVDAAARTFFGKSARDVSLGEAAEIAGLLKAPSRFSPTNDPAAAAERGAVVLDAMVEAGFVTRAEADAAELPGAASGTAVAGDPNSEDIVALALNAQGFPLPGAKPEAPHQDSDATYPYFVDWVKNQIPHIIGQDIDRDLFVVTTLDPGLQRAAESAIHTTLATSGAQAHASQAAFVAFSSDGALLAMVGGRDYAESSYNRAAQARRQPGSSFKTFVYLAGLEAGLRPESLVLDGPISIGNWHPENYEHNYRGEIPMITALSQSLNTPTVRIMQFAGIDRVRRIADLMGISSTLGTELSLALGTSEVSLAELTRAYLPFSTGGLQPAAYAVTEVRDRDGNVIYSYTPPPPRRLIPEAMAGAMNQMLSEVIRSGTGRGANLGRPMAGKTGTSQDYRDAWFIGFTADATAGVWMGNDDNSPMRNITGGNLPARIWRQAMSVYLRDKPVRPLPAIDAYQPLYQEPTVAGDLPAGVLPAGVQPAGVQPAGIQPAAAPGVPAAVPQGPIPVDDLGQLVRELNAAYGN